MKKKILIQVNINLDDYEKLMEYGFMLEANISA